MKRFLFVSLAVVGVMGATPLAHATVLNPGDSSTTISTSTLAGLTLVDTFSVTPAPLAGPGGGVPQSIFGTYQEWVYADAAGHLTFLEQVNLDSSSTLVHRVTASTYTGFTTNVSYLTGSLPATATSGGTAPNNTGGTVIDRTTAATVGFNFTTTPISPGTSSAVLVIATNATSYDRLGVLSVIDGTTSSNLTFEPTNAVPEPSTMALAGLGAMGLIGYGLRRRKALGA